MAAANPTGSTLGDLFSGLSMPLRGIGLLLSNGALAGLAALPVALTAIGTFATAGLMAKYGDRLLAGLWVRPAACDGCGWAQWAWTRLEVGAWHVAWALVAAAVTIAIAVVVSRIITAPLMDLLAERAMKRLGVRPPPGVAAFGALPLAHSIPISILRALGRSIVLLAGILLIAAIGLVPGGAIVATPAGLAWTAIWLFADTMLYALQWVGPARLDDVRAFVRERPALSLGFALSTSLLMLVPLAGLLVTPAAVAGACLLVQRAGPPRTALVPRTA